MKYGEIDYHHDKLHLFVEHGQEFAQCLGCGQSWSIAKCETQDGDEYEDLESLSSEDELLCNGFEE